MKLRNLLLSALACIVVSGAALAKQDSTAALGQRSAADWIVVVMLVEIALIAVTGLVQGWRLYPLVFRPRSHTIYKSRYELFQARVIFSVISAIVLPLLVGGATWYAVEALGQRGVLAGVLLFGIPLVAFTILNKVAQVIMKSIAHDESE